TIGINKGYSKPTPDITSLEKIGKYYYLIQKDNDEHKYYLFAESNPASGILVSPTNITVSDDIVGGSYWNVLSAKSVQYSAGIIDLFFKEVSKAQSDPVYAKNFNVEPKSFIGQIVSSVASFTGTIKDTAVQALRQLVGGNSGNLVQVVDLTSTSSVEHAVSSTPVVQGNVKYKLQITEIMYNPEGSDAGKEWVEIENLDQVSIDLTKLTLRVDESNHKINKSSGFSLLPPGGYAVIADDQAAFRSLFPSYSGILADSAVSLKNSSGKIETLNGDVLLDGVTYYSDWGGNGDGNSLQLIGGQWLASTPTPGAANKIAFVPSKLKIPPGEGETTAVPAMEATSTKPASTSTGDSENEQKQQTASTSSVAQTCSFADSGASGYHSVIFNEVAWMGSVNSANDEWIELRNISNSAVDISGWHVLSGDGHIKAILPERAVISPSGFYLLERTNTNSIPGVTADFAYTGSLVNTGTDLKLFDNNCALVDSVSGANGWLAGDSSSRRTMERDLNGNGWHTSSAAGGTPRRENDSAFLSQSGGGGGVVISQSPALNNQDTQETSTPVVYPKLLITEVQLASSSSTKDEFVEIYNPNDTELDLTGWSVMKKTKTADSFSTFAKADLFNGKSIKSKSFLVIANSEGGVSGDIFTTYGVSEDNSVAIKNPNHGVVDNVGWGEAGDCEGMCAPQPTDDKSIERKMETGEFMDSGDNFSDFEVGECPHPGAYSLTCMSTTSTATSTDMATVSLPLINDFSASYNSNDLKISLSWEPFVPISTASTGTEEAATSTVEPQVFYTVQLSTSTSLDEVAWESDYISNALVTPTSSTSTSLRIDEVGRGYGFRVAALDENGTALAEATSSVNVPSFLSSLNFYPDPRSGNDAYLIDVFYQGIPFIPPLWSGTSGTQTNWRLMAFYLDTEANKPEYFNVSTSSFSVKYQSCGGAQVSAPSIVFPSGLCEYGPYSQDVSPAVLEDPTHILLSSALSVSGLNLSTSSFITVAYYDRDPDVFGDRRFKLVAVDRDRYYLQDLSLEEVQNLHSAPEFSSAFTAQFKPDSSALVVSWDPAHDADSWDGSISYEINISPAAGIDDSLWQALVPEPRADFSDPQHMSYRYSRFANIGDDFAIALRAKDEFGKSSAVTTSTWQYPATDIAVSQEQWNGEWGSGFGSIDSHLNFSAPDSASLERISSSSAVLFDKFTVKVRQNGIGGYAPSDLRLSIYADASGTPDFSSPLGESVIRNLDPLSDPQDITFSFASPVTLPAESGGWAVLDVAGYGGLQGYFNNSWQNAVTSGDLYSGGDSGFGSGRGTNSDCSQCAFGGYAPSGVDWYMKLGLTRL
ncbi:MAG: lamin tail domain-containing protein, partial [Patescibacteria group bacterium]|nr:lamin tail domain-containing protein [Patescibacteria group bacterium]